MSKKVRIYLIAIISVILIVSLLFAFLYLPYKDKQYKQIAIDSSKEIEELTLDFQQDKDDYHKAYRFILNHLPYEMEDGTIEMSNDGLAVNFNSTVNDVNGRQKAIISQLYLAIQERNIDIFLSLFTHGAKSSYLGQFDGFIESEKALNNAFDTILRGNTLTGVGIVQSAKGENYRVYFLYSNKERVKTELIIQTFEDSSYIDDAYLISSSMEEFIRSFEE